MYECPHCGEPLDEDAEFCHQCGSDVETGWNPDIDYHAVELPEDDLADDEVPAPGEAAQPRGRIPVDYGLLVAAVIVFIGASFVAYGWAAVLPLFFLAACAVIVRLLVKKGPTRY